MRVEPPLIITREEIDTILNRLEDTLHELHASVLVPPVPVASETGVTTRVIDSNTIVRNVAVA